MNFGGGMGQGALQNSKGAFYLPFAFMITGFLSLLIFSVLIVFSGDTFSFTEVRLPFAIGIVHLFILGWATMLVMGAVYQLVPVVIQSELYSTKLGMIHYFAFTGGLVGMLLGFFQFNLITLAISASLVVIGVLLFITNIVITIIKTKNFNTIIFATYSALFYLLLTVVSGLLMAINFGHPFLNGLHTSILAAHIWFGLVGWFLFLIVGYSFKMLPMFYLSHDFPTNLQKWILILFHVALLIITANFFLQAGFMLTWIGFVVFLAGLLVYRVHVQQIIKTRFKKNPGKGILVTVRILDGFIGLTGIAIVLLMIQPQLFSNLTFLSIISLVYLFGWVSLTILGYTSKIVPFLWWTFRFGNQVGREQVPSLHDLIDEQKVYVRFIGCVVTLLILAVGMAIQLPLLIIIGQISFGLATIYYLVHVLAVFTHS
ncbi:hypothetical protein ACJ2A9_11985 [Anaerobacillus sp. MEB173]|uniref:hypothetical protein n=1 Tax=Anaerobacillus sp. MEB173 TaxID=3383345 RepID=UPI003F8FC24E